MASLLFFSTLVSFILLLIFPIAIVNFIIVGGKKSIFTSLFMFWKIERNNSKDNSAERMKKNLSLLTFEFFSGKYIRKMTQIFLKGMEIFGLILFSIGGIELSNDFRSHVNPDIFDFFFPDIGGKFFWGGLAIFSLSSFFLYFILKSQNLKDWKKRYSLTLVQNSFWQKMLVPEILMHPYFFLSLAGREVFSNSNLNQKDEMLFKLFNKAWRQNKRMIPDEWMEEIR